jgi:acetoin utilization deacetylase AcuC-like enzyme
MATGFVWHERYMWHETPFAAGWLPSRGVLPPGEYFENPETKRRMKQLMDGYGITQRLVPIEPYEADDAILRRFHTAAYLETVRALSDGMGGDAGDFAPIGPGTDPIARLAVGGVISAIDAVLDGRVSNAYALVRPPGHHAERDRGRGFCVYSNIAVALLDALERGRISRAAVVDWDVHHGNGTEQAFWERGDVLTISLHQDHLYPDDSGEIDKTGAGAGEGFNLNVPLPPGCGGGAYLSAMERVVLPALRAFRPELIVVASGFDASSYDPLGHMMLFGRHYAAMTRLLMDAADELCDGRLVASHEGGYSEAYVPFCGVATIDTLRGEASDVVDVLGALPEKEWQLLQPWQEAAIDAAVKGPLALLESRV